MKSLMYKHMLRLRNRHFFLIDAAIICFSPALALLLRFDNLSWWETYGRVLAIYVVLSLSTRLLVFYLMGFYKRYWRYASVDEIGALGLAMLTTCSMCTALFFGLSEFTAVFSPRLPRSLPFIDSALVAIFIGGVRFAVRLAYVLNERIGTRAGCKQVLIVGAGIAGSMIATELRANPAAGMSPIGFVDDDPAKRGMEIRGIKVLGALKDIPRIVHDQGIDEVILAMPSASGRIIRNILQVCKILKVNSRTIPGVFEILSGSAVAQLREIRIEDLLRRESVEINAENVETLIHSTKVMVTGAGGSIGSELCRQIANFRPSELVMVGHGEDSIFQIANEMRTKHGVIIGERIKYRTVIADIRDRERMNQVFRQYRPQTVFHAAAHKHVGLMEVNCPDAVTNNILGTQVVVDLAAYYGVDKFVMISSDKAVHPTSIMGVTKRVAELVVHEAAMRYGKAFVVVRFGNVLGSRGSVVPIFKNQIQAGGPVKVTDMDASRFFMTIPEAVQLVLQAGAMARCGETYVLDMGQPIKIVELARDLIRLSGLREGIDIDIVFTGLQPGEKLREQLFYDEEKPERSAHEKIFVCRNGQAIVEYGGQSVAGETDSFGAEHDKNRNGNSFHHKVQRLVRAAQIDETDLLQELLAKLVPTYHNPFVRVADVKPENGGKAPSSASILSFDPIRVSVTK